MKRASKTQSTTSLEMAPADDENARLRTYLLTMGIRTVCVILCAVVVPYGWHTAIFAVGAIALPYFAVIVANAASGRRVETAVHPEARRIESSPAAAPDPATPGVIRVTETPRPAARPEGDA